jgi:hypothetical protein
VVLYSVEAILADTSLQHATVKKKKVQMKFIMKLRLMCSNITINQMVENRAFFSASCDFRTNNQSSLCSFHAFGEAKLPTSP